MFLSGCIDLVKTSVSVSSRNKISFRLLFGAVNGCEEIHLSVSRVHSQSSEDPPPPWGGLMRYKSGL